jgi:hypothetical protein
MAINPFQGFDYIPSSDIKTAENQQFQQALQSGNQHQMRAAVFQQVANTMGGGSQTYKKSKKVEKVLQQAFDELPNDDDDIVNQIEFQRKAQKLAIDAGLPDIAMQATTNLAQLESVQEERQRLKAQDARLEAAEGRAQEAHELQVEADRINNRHLTTGLLIDPETLEIVDRGDLTNAEDLARMNKTRAERKGLVLRTEGEFVELTEAEKDRKARIKGLGSGMAGRSTLYKDWYKKTQGIDAFTTTAGDFIDLLLEDDANVIFAAGGKSRAMLSRAAAHSRSFLPAESAIAVEEAFAKNPRYNKLSSDQQALVIELGYALATSRESGRLTDQDVDRAIRTLGVDNPDPRAVAWIFGRALKRQRDTYSRSLKTSGIEDVEGVAATHQMVLSALDEQIARLETKYQIDFEDEDIFDNITGPTAASAGLNEKGTRVRQVQQGGRGAAKLRDFTEAQ